MKKFKEETFKTIESLIDFDLPDESIEKIIEGVKAKINIDDAKEGLSKLTNLFK